MICPHCGFDNHDLAFECEKCGIVFSKIGHSGAPPGGAAPGGAPPPPAALLPTHLKIAGEGAGAPQPKIAPFPYNLLAIGIIGALLVSIFWLTRAPFDILRVLFHEMGHAIVAWLLGHPAIPAFDFMFGGGLTNWGQFHLSIALAIAAGFGFLGWRLRENRIAVAVIAAVFVIWLIFVTKDWRQETAIATAGVLSEIVFASIFLYMALAGIGWRIPEIERPLGAIIAFYTEFHVWTFLIQLTRSQEFLAHYKEGKGGALMNDLEIVALNLKIYLGMDTTIQSVAKMIFVFSFIPFGLAFWLALRHERVEEAVEELITEASS